MSQLNLSQYIFPILQRIFSATMETMQLDKSFIVVGPVALGVHLPCDKLKQYMRDINLRPSCIDLCVKPGTSKDVAKRLVDNLRKSMVRYGEYTAFTHMLEFTLQAVQPGSTGMMSLPTWNTNQGIEMIEMTDSNTIYIKIQTQVKNHEYQFIPFVTVVECKNDVEWNDVQNNSTHMWQMNAMVVKFEYLINKNSVTSLEHKTKVFASNSFEEYNKDPVVFCRSLLISDTDSDTDFDFISASKDTAKKLDTQFIEFIQTYSINSTRFNSAYLRAVFDKNYDPTNDGKGVFEDKSLSFGGLREGLLSAVSQVESINKGHKPFMVFRGVDYFQLFDDQKRDIFMMDKFAIANFTFSSTSVNPCVAISFAKKDSICCLLVLEVPTEYTRYVAMGDYKLSNYPDEQEVLFPDDAVFSIEKCTYKIFKEFTRSPEKKILELHGTVVSRRPINKGGGVSRNSSGRRPTKKQCGGNYEQLRLIDLTLLQDRKEPRKCCGGLSLSQEEALRLVFTREIPTRIHDIPEPWQIEHKGMNVGHPVFDGVAGVAGGGRGPTNDARRIQLYAKTVTQLRNVARKKGDIRGFSRMRKEELINALLNCATRRTRPCHQT